MSLTVKAFLYQRSWKEEPVEIRRFSLDQDVSSNYSYLVQKIAQVFPSVAAEEVVLSWEDAEGDYINISSDDELLEALDQFDGSIFKIHLKKREKPLCCPQPVFCPLPCHPSQPPASHGKEGGEEKMEAAGSGSGSEQKPEQKEGPRHSGVICDGCNFEIYGVRYKCLVCPDYDLCSSCEKKGEHVDHNMVTIRDPQNYSPWGFPRGGRCGGGPWRGRRGGRHCGGRGRHGGQWGHGGPWIPPFFLQNFLGGQWGAPPRQEQQQEPEREKPAEGKSEEMETEEQQTSAQDQAQLEKEQRQGYLQDIGEAVSTFLRPFGVKVDVDVVDEEKPKKTDAPADTSDPAPSAPSKVPSGYEGNTLYPTLDAATTTEGETTDPVEAVLLQLQGMGFDNEGGWLTELVKAKGGDIGKVLDALHPSQSD